MTERERREGTGGTGDNVENEPDKVTRDRKKDATPDAVEEEESTGGGGRVKDNASDDSKKARNH